jgi:hypothetical protein
MSRNEPARLPPKADLPISHNNQWLMLKLRRPRAQSSISLRVSNTDEALWAANPKAVPMAAPAPHEVSFPALLRKQ